MLQIPNFKRYIATEAIIGAGATIAGAGIGAVSQGNLNKKTREWNAEQAEKQREWSEKMYNEQNAWNYEMWQKQNEYNSPEQQLARMRDAGLNPLYYGLDGSSAEGVSASQPLGYERAQVGNQVNPFGNFTDVAMKAAQVTAMELENEKKKKELGWADQVHDVEMQIKQSTVEEIQKRVEKADTDIANGKMDTKLKEKDLDKKDAEIAVEWAKYTSLGLDNKHKEILNPLLERAQQLENELAETRNQYEAERILAELAETKAHTASLYAQCALDGARTAGVKLDNKIKEAEAKWAPTNAKNKSRLMQFTADEAKYQASILKNTWRSKVSVEKYYAEHYEEAFRNSWSSSGVEWKTTEAIGEMLGTTAMLGMMLAF